MSERGEALREMAAEVEALEAENEKLRADLKHAREETEGLRRWIETHSGAKDARPESAS